MPDKKKVHIVGTHGVPAKYGGFETLADFLCQNLGGDFDITVYCNAHKYAERVEDYFGARLLYLKLEANGFRGILYDILTYIHALFQTDIILYLSPVGSGFITPLKYVFPKRKVIINHGGLNEWEREKLSWIEKKWAKLNHRIASIFSDLNIADNNIYKKSLKDNFGAESMVIRYGGDHVIKSFDCEKELSLKYPFTGQKYAVSVSRAQVDNNLHLVLEAFEDFEGYKLVLISNWEISQYGKDLKTKYSENPNVILLDAIYDKEELDFIRGNADVYIHTHSRCGTAPSLVEAMNFEIPIISFDVPTNRETTQDKALFFNSSKELNEILRVTDSKELKSNAENMFKIGSTQYSWPEIVEQYKTLFHKM